MWKVSDNIGPAVPDIGVDRADTDRRSRRHVRNPAQLKLFHQSREQAMAVAEQQPVWSKWQVPCAVDAEFMPAVGALKCFIQTPVGSVCPNAAVLIGARRQSLTQYVRCLVAETRCRPECQLCLHRVVG